MSRRALQHLRRIDPTLGGIIASVGAYGLVPDGRRSHFAALADAIIQQQLSIAAARTIHRRVLAAVGGSMRPAAVLATPDAALRGAGVSTAKVLALRDLAAQVIDGRLPVRRLATMDDAAVTEALVRVRGIGEWTAQMHLMFKLGRPDVLPVGDLALQAAVQRAYRLRTRPSPKELARIGAPWAPYRSVAAWYLWRYLEG